MRCRIVASTLLLLLRLLLLLAALPLRLRRLPLLLQSDLRLLQGELLLRRHATIRCCPLCLLRQSEPTLVIRKSDRTRRGNLGEGLRLLQGLCADKSRRGRHLRESVIWLNLLQRHPCRRCGCSCRLCRRGYRSGLHGAASTHGLPFGGGDGGADNRAYSRSSDMLRWSAVLHCGGLWPPTGLWSGPIGRPRQLRPHFAQTGAPPRGQRLALHTLELPDMTADHKG